MKILLIRPPARHIKGSAKPSVSLPLGLLYIAAVLEKNSYAVQLYDAQASIDAPFYYDSDGIMQVGDNWETVKKQIISHKPDLIGISNLFTAQFENAIKVAEIAKRVNKNIVTVVGGNHSSVKPEDFFLKTEAIDLACIGEGELTMLEISAAYRDKKSLEDISGTAVKKDGRVKINGLRPYISNLDELPNPAYHLINLEDYFYLNAKGLGGRPMWRYPGSEKTISVITSRGCPFNCIFCSIHLHMGNKWRFHSAENVLKHLELIISKYKVKHIHFEDDNLTLNTQRFKEIIDGLFSRKIKITWDTPNGIRADMMSKEILQAGWESGCTYIILGVESGEQRVLSEIINKQLDLDKVIKVASWSKEIGLDTMAFFVIGFPGETIADMKKTVQLALKLMKDYDIWPTIFMATPLIGTNLYNICLEKGYLRKELSSENLAKSIGGSGEDLMVQTEDFTPEQVSMVMKDFIRGYKAIFLRHFLLFMLKNPFLWVKFIKSVWSLKREIGIKRAITETLSLKNCFKRKFDI